MSFYMFGHSGTLPESHELVDAATASPEDRAQLLRAAGLDSNPAIDPRTTRARQAYIEAAGEDLTLWNAYFSAATPVEKFTGPVSDEAVIVFTKARELGLAITIHRSASGECLATGMLNDCTFLLGQWGWPADSERTTIAKSRQLLADKIGQDEANEYRRTTIAFNVAVGLICLLDPILAPSVSFADKLSFWATAGASIGCAYAAYARLGRAIRVAMLHILAVSVVILYIMVIIG